MPPLSARDRGGAPTPPTLLERLRTATSAHHARVEEALPLADPRLTLDEYRRALAAFYGYYRPTEAALADAAPALASLGIGVAERQKAALLAHDLRALGMDAAEVARLPTPSALPDLGGAARALGALYVLEGATLGGRIIARHVAATLRLTPERGASFFAGYGDRVGAMWAGYRAAVERYAAGGGDEDAVVAAAVETFAGLERWLGEVRVVRRES